MKFLCIYKPGKPEGTPPAPEHMAEMGKLIGEGIKAGWLLSTEGCLPSALGARVRQSDGKVTVTDGPFTEAKEIIGGFALIRAASKAEATDAALISAKPPMISLASVKGPRRSSAASR